MSPRLAVNPEGELLCPRCGGNYLHHARVEVFCRPEDAAFGVHADIRVGGDFPIEQAKAQVLVDGNMAGNPSIRRGGIRIHFECELCGWNSTLDLAQHKGVTEVIWR